MPAAAISAFRFGFGLPSGGAGDPQAMLASLTGPDLAAGRWPGITTAAALPLAAAAQRAQGAARRDPDLRRDFRKAQALVTAQATHALRVAMARASGSDHGFRERLVWFWADHFTAVARSAPGRALPSAMVEDAIRPHLAGRFADMLQAAVTHPAMLVYLDQASSIGPNSNAGLKRERGLNENLARELLELHTLGAGAGYGQQDVRQLAELLTGLAVNLDRGTVFQQGRAEPGAETVLGVTYGPRGMQPIHDALQDLAVHPETARHLSWKLAVHFLSDDPDAGLVQAMAAEWLRTGGDLAAVYAVLLADPAAMALPLAKARRPQEFLAASLRALALGGDAVMALPDKVLDAAIRRPMAGMGQPWQAPPGPDGWAEGAGGWITPQGLAARIDWAMSVPETLLPALPDPVALAHAALGPLADRVLLRSAPRAENLREGVGLVLASPAFNRR